MAMDLSECIGQPVSGYVSSPAHSARFISAIVESRYGALPRSIHQSRGYSFRVVFADGSKHVASMQFAGAPYQGAPCAVVFDQTN